MSAYEILGIILLGIVAISILIAAFEKRSMPSEAKVRVDGVVGQED